MDVFRLPLLPGEDAGWVDVARARHGATLLDALDGWPMRGCAPSGTWWRRRVAREAVHCEPLHEAGHQRLLRVLMAKGDHAAVVTAYTACRRVLAEELGVSPSPDTEAIYRQALGVESDVAAVRRCCRGAGGVGTRAPFPPTLVEHATTLIGRESELVWLWSLWRRARVESPLVIVVVGPPGRASGVSPRRSPGEVYAGRRRRRATCV